MEKRFPPLPTPVRDQLDLYRMWKDMGDKALGEWLERIAAGTAEFQDAVKAYENVEYFENLREKADEILAENTEQAEKIMADAIKWRDDAKAKMDKRAEDVDDRQKQRKAEQDARDAELTSRDKDLAAREKALAEREKKCQVDVQKNADERTRLEAEMEKIKALQAKFDEAKALLG